MADYKYDGKELRCRGSKIGVVDGNAIRNSSGSKVGEIDGKYIRNAQGSKIGEFDGQVIRDSNGSRLGTMDDVKKKIDGVGGISLAAIWLLFVR